MKLWDLFVSSFLGLNARLLTLMPPTHFDWWRLGLLDLTKRVICSLRGLPLLVRVDQFGFGLPTSSDDVEEHDRSSICLMLPVLCGFSLALKIHVCTQVQANLCWILD